MSTSDWLRARTVRSAGASRRALIRRAPLSVNSPCRYLSRSARFFSERFTPRSSMIGTAALAALNWIKGETCGFDYIKSDRQRRQPAKAKIVTPGDLARFEGQVRQAAGQGCENQLAFDPRQSSAETEVTGPTERQVSIVSPAQVQTIRIGKSFGVAIAGAHYRDHRLAFANPPAAQLKIFRTNSRGVLAGTLVAQ